MRWWTQRRDLAKVRRPTGRSYHQTEETDTHISLSRMDMLRRKDTSTHSSPPVTIEVTASAYRNTIEDGSQQETRDFAGQDMACSTYAMLWQKLEASRAELTDVYWQSGQEEKLGVRDVDCVITARELQCWPTPVASASQPPRQPLDPQYRIPFPDPKLDAFLFPRYQLDQSRTRLQQPLRRWTLRRLPPLPPNLQSIPPRQRDPHRARPQRWRGRIHPRPRRRVLKVARYYGFRNIQNLVRKLKPPRKSRMPGGKTVMLEWAVNLANWRVRQRQIRARAASMRTWRSWLAPAGVRTVEDK
jgi:hypothetical protein